MRNFFSLLVVSVLIVDESSTVRVDYSSHDRIPRIFGSLQFRTPLSVVVELNAGMHTVLYHNNTSTRSLFTHIPSQLVRQVLPMVSFNNSSPVYGRSVGLGIGPGSDLVNLFGTVATVHDSIDSGRLLFNLTQDEFASQYCLPDSLMRIPTLILRGRVSLAFTMGGQLLSPIEQRIRIIFDHSPHLLVVHEIIWSSLFHNFTRELVLSNSVISECSRNLQRFPAIHLSLISDSTLVISADDYTHSYNEETDECKLSIASSSRLSSPQDVIFNPLIIPGFDSLSFGNFLVLCESIHFSG
jgi:hypothetical protein